MNWYRQVKTLYTTTLTIFFFIMWAFIEKIIFQNNIKYSLIIITLISVFLMQYLIYKKVNKYLSVAIPLIISVLILHFILKDSLIIVNLIFVAATMIYSLTIENDNITYYQCKRILTNGLYLIVPIGVIGVIFRSDLIMYLFRAYMFYLILMIITFRESLRYMYNIRNKSSIYVNLGIVLGIVALCQDYAFKAFNKFMTWILGIVSFVIDAILTLMIKIFEKPMQFIVDSLKEIMMKNQHLEEMLDRLGNESKVREFIYEETTFKYPIWIKIVLLIIVLYLLYKIVSQIAIGVKVNESYVECVESINEKSQEKKPSYISKFIKKIFRKKGDVREEILYNYKNFEEITEKADIYKTYMTATQLKNVTKVKIDNVDGLNDMTNIYNKAKFSTQELSEEDLQQVKNSYENIKKQI